MAFVLTFVTLGLPLAIFALLYLKKSGIHESMVNRRYSEFNVRTCFPQYWPQCHVVMLLCANVLPASI